MVGIPHIPYHHRTPPTPIATHSGMDYLTPTHSIFPPWIGSPYTELHTHRTCLHTCHAPTHTLPRKTTVWRILYGHSVCSDEQADATRALAAPASAVYAGDTRCVRAIRTLPTISYERVVKAGYKEAILLHAASLVSSVATGRGVLKAGILGGASATWNASRLPDGQHIMTIVGPMTPLLIHLFLFDPLRCLVSPFHLPYISAVYVFRHIHTRPLSRTKHLHRTAYYLPPAPTPATFATTQPFTHAALPGRRALPGPHPAPPFTSNMIWWKGGREEVGGGWYGCLPL